MGCGASSDMAPISDVDKKIWKGRAKVLVKSAVI
jgi:hypothetical protein